MKESGMDQEGDETLNRIIRTRITDFCRCKQCNYVDIRLMARVSKSDL